MKTFVFVSALLLALAGAAQARDLFAPVPGDPWSPHRDSGTLTQDPLPDAYGLPVYRFHDGDEDTTIRRDPLPDAYGNPVYRFDDDD